MNESRSMVQQSFNFSFLPPHIYDKPSFTLQIMCPERQSLKYVQLLLINKQRNFPVIKVKTSTFFFFPLYLIRRRVFRGTLLPTAWSSCQTLTLCSVSGWPFAWVASGKTSTLHDGAAFETAHTRSSIPCCQIQSLR